MKSHSVGAFKGQLRLTQFECKLEGTPQAKFAHRKERPLINSLVPPSKVFEKVLLGFSQQLLAACRDLQVTKVS